MGLPFLRIQIRHGILNLLYNKFCAPSSLCPRVVIHSLPTLTMKASIITILLFVVSQAAASQRGSIGNSVAFRSVPTTRLGPGYVSTSRRSVTLTDNDIQQVQNCAVSDWNEHLLVQYSILGVSQFIRCRPLCPFICI